MASRPDLSMRETESEEREGISNVVSQETCHESAKSKLSGEKRDVACVLVLLIVFYSRALN